MSLTSATPNNNSTDTTTQDHHVKAAEHLESASQCHRHAAKCVSEGDHETVASKVKEAAEHIEQATSHIESAKQVKESAHGAHDQLGN